MKTKIIIIDNYKSSKKLTQSVNRFLEKAETLAPNFDLVDVKYSTWALPDSEYGDSICHSTLLIFNLPERYFVAV